jgi:SAM-dependent methyltransferase
MNQATAPVWQLDERGAVRPNPVFQRGQGNLHSRCIEYPWTASRYRGGGRVLDVGSAQTSPHWAAWLRSLPAEVTCTDCDEGSEGLLAGLKFVRADVRRLGFADGAFDEAFAVSVIEHIGLARSLSVSETPPPEEEAGDAAALAELLRVLAPGGRLTATFPYSCNFGLILGGCARCYSRRSIGRFRNPLGDMVESEYYQHVRAGLGAGPEAFTWQRLDERYTTARQEAFVDGVLCCVWKRR